METTSMRVANRCLPLLMANEAGWWILCSHGFSATWSGGSSAQALQIDYDEDIASHQSPAESRFGYGIVTFRVPYLFRTTRGWNLLARGPANLPKHGAAALEGLVETDWAVSTFTMNWKLTAPGSVRFDEGEPICMLVPQRRSELETFSPRMAAIADEPDLEAAFRGWSAQRERMKVEKWVVGMTGLQASVATAWDQNYFRGRGPEGEAAPEHQTKLRLRSFSEASDSG